jgi:hypothetical protein
MHGGDEECIQIPGQRPLGRQNLRWEDNIKMDLKEMV